MHNIITGNTIYFLRQGGDGILRVFYIYNIIEIGLVVFVFKISNVDFENFRNNGYF